MRYRVSFLYLCFVVICMFVTEGAWQTWGQWKQSAPGVSARIRTKDAQDQCPNKYQGTVIVTLYIQEDNYCTNQTAGMSSILTGTNLSAIE